VPYNLLVEDGLEVFVYELEHFLQWGTPEDLAEYQAWSDRFARFRDWRPQLPPMRGVNLIPSAGSGQRFVRAGYGVPKPLVSVDGRPMIDRALSSLPAAERWVAVCRAGHLHGGGLQAALRNNGRAVDVIALEHDTAGGAATCLEARPVLPPHAPLLVAPCDTALVYDTAAYAALTSSGDVDCVVWTFRNHPHANRHPYQYGWVRTAGDVVTGISCKAPISDDVARDPGIVGAFWFREARFFLEAAEALVSGPPSSGGEYHADLVVQALVEQGRRARVFDVDHYICLGTPDDVRTFEYWAAYFRKVAARRIQAVS
jgi:NDP-sugar pyrophosphorylase family protein